ncbi:hypothetical protein Pve01_95320 [Planomonospora venezuelensis]|nr:hypothetical protein Pve01_95320 [Planomonospora venezuelensis]
MGVLVRSTTRRSPMDMRAEVIAARRRTIGLSICTPLSRVRIAFEAASHPEED